MTLPADAVIGAHAVVEAGAAIGARCRIGAGAFVGAGVMLGDEVEVGANATLASAHGSAASGSAAATAHTRVADGVRIGAGATVVAGVAVHTGAWIKPGAVVTRAVPPGAIVEGNPAVMTGHVGAVEGPTADRRVARARAASHEPAEDWIQPTAVEGVAIYNFPVIKDMRGDLTVGEFDRQIPFKPLRYFMVFDVPSREIRGEHAHHTCHEFLVCVRGQCAVAADDGTHRVEVLLDTPARGVYLPPMTWRVHYKYSPDAILLVFASHHYDPSDYVRDYGEFMRLVQG
jgi:UDP-2-acetamido-3-amino-2,3-dideoxy-glucuronate N-acetyltransferase